MTDHKCERWVDDPERGNKRRCGAAAVRQYVPENAPGYEWWACDSHYEATVREAVQ